jgi:hypothetical protein
VPLCRPDDASRAEKERGKVPLIKNWQNRASADLAQLEKWAVEFPGCNWGAATGHRSGIFVLDVDGEQGELTLKGLKQQGHELPDTLSVATGSGRHLYFRCPQGQEIRNSVSQIGTRLDIRGERGQVVVPPSIHRSGVHYSYADPNVPIAESPQWLLDKVAGPRRASTSVLYQHYRNDGLTRLAGAMRRKGASREELERRLLAENTRRCKEPLDEKDVLKIAASVARYPTGGPDPLEIAWEKVKTEEHATTYAKFMALARHLQLARPDFPIALPLERIGELMGFNWTLVRRYRSRAVSDGLLVQVKTCIPKRMAALFRVHSSSE